MNKKQLIVAVLALVTVLALFVLGQQTDKEAHANSEEKHTPMGPKQGTPIQAASFENILEEGLKQLSPDQKIVESKLRQKAIDDPTAINYKNIAEYWEDAKNLNIAAYFYKKAALLENTEKSVTFAGNLFLTLMQNSATLEIKKWQALEAVGCFEKALEINPSNTDTKIALANCYTDGTEEPMKGVLLLREITKNDSLNLKANLVLGKLSVKSGQYDKAINRMEIVLSQDPNNTEAMYFMAEAYKGQGNKEKAIELFEKCKSIVNNPDFDTEIDNYINSFR